MPPNAVEAEAALVGFLMIDNRGISTARAMGLEAEHFYDGRLGMIYQAIVELRYVEGEGVDTITVPAHLKKMGNLDQCGGISRIVELTSDVPIASPLQVGSYGDLILGASTARAALEDSAELTLRITAGELPGGPTPALAWKIEHAGRSVVVSGTGWGEDALVSFASGANMLIHEAVYIPPVEDIEDAGVIADPERLRLEAELHTSILNVGSLATRAKVETLVLVRMRPPPFFELQVTNIVGRDFDGEIVVPDDGTELSP